MVVGADNTSRSSLLQRGVYRLEQLHAVREPPVNGAKVHNSRARVASSVELERQDDQLGGQSWSPRMSLPRLRTGRAAVELDTHVQVWNVRHRPGSFCGPGVAAHREGTLNFSSVALSSVAMPRTALLERERDLARISELIDGAAAGDFGLAVVEGPAGAGKSALLGALASLAAETGLRVLRATGLELERDYPFGVARQLLEPAIAGLDEPARRGLFAGAAAPAESLLSGGTANPPPSVADPGFALLHALYWVLAGLTDLTPLAVVVDDVQWADLLTLRFLAFAVKRADGLALLVALGLRDLPAAEQPNALAAGLSGLARVLRPAPLSRQAIGSLLTPALGRKPDEVLVVEAERLTEGNPLYVRELADSLSAARDDNGEDASVLLRSVAPSAVSRRVQTSLWRLDAGARAMATATAILGEDVPLRRAATLARLTDEQAIAAADALARADILRVGEPLRFRHPLVRDAVLTSVEPRARANANSRAARLLIAEGESPEHAAVHLIESDPAGDAEVVALLRVSARRAVGQSASTLAISALRRALREPPTQAERPLVLKELATVEAQVGDAEAFGHFEQAFASAASLADMADGAVRYAMQLGARGRREEADALIDRVLRAIGDRERRLMLEAELSTLAINAEIPGARERLLRVTAPLHGETPAERLLLGLRAHDAANAAAIGAAEAAERIRAALGDGFLLEELGPDSPTYLQLVGGLQWIDELDHAERELSAAVVEARGQGAAFGLAVASSMLGLVAWKRGRLAIAEAEARTGVEIATQMGWVAAFPFPLACLVDVLSDAGKLDEADRLIHDNDLAGPLPTSHAVTELLGARGRLRLAQGQLEQGIKDLEEQAARLDQVADSPPNLRAHLAKSLVPALRQTGNNERARAIADRALGVARAFGQPRFIADSLHARALAGDEPDTDQLHQAAEIYERIGAPIELARTLVDLGMILRRQRHPAASREPLSRARDLALTSGAQPLADRAEHELRASGARPRRPRITGRDSLTPTERRVAQLAIEGMNNPQIAQSLFITRKTVESHLERTFRKLDIHTRAELERALRAEHDLASAANER